MILSPPTVYQVLCFFEWHSIRAILKKTHTAFSNNADPLILRAFAEIQLDFVQAMTDNRFRLSKSEIQIEGREVRDFAALESGEPCPTSIR